MVNRNKNKFILALLLCVAVMANAQERYQWQAKLSGVNGPGFYRILLNPDITGRSQTGYGDIRIVDSTGHYVPYLVQSEAPVSQRDSFFSFSFRTEVDSLFQIYIENPNGRHYEELQLTLRNTDIGREAVVTGSDDGDRWYDITNIVIHPGRSREANTFDQTISLPPDGYHHLRIAMRRSRAIPLNVLRVGAYEAFISEGKYSLVPAAKPIQKDSAKVSYISLHYDKPYQLDKFVLHIDGPRLYHRTARIYSTDTTDASLLCAATLSSDKNNTIDISVKKQDLLIEVDNQDNPSLSVISIEAFQLNKYAAMYLDGDRDYFLVFGNQKANTPVYDIGYFADSLRMHPSKEMTTVAISPNTIIPGTEAITQAAAKNQKAYWIWPVLIAILGILLFFTFRMGKEIDAKEQQ